MNNLGDTNLDVELTAIFEQQLEHNRQTIDAGPIRLQIAKQTGRRFGGWVMPTLLATGTAAALIAALVLGGNDSSTEVELPPATEQPSEPTTLPTTVTVETTPTAEPATTTPTLETVATTPTVEPVPTPPIVETVATTPTVETTVPPTSAASGFTTLGVRDEDPETVIARVTALLGAPTDDSGWREEQICFGQTRWVNWGNLGLLFSDSERDFYRGFTGAVYAGPVQGLTLPAEVGDPYSTLAAS